MKRIFFLAALLFLNIHLFAQKLLIDSNAYYDQWPSITSIDISNDGKYVSHIIHDPAIQHDSLFIRSLEGKWQRTYVNAGSPFLTQDSKRIVFERHDTIFLVSLGNSQVEYLTGIDEQFRHVPYDRNDDLLLYKVKNDPNQLHIRKINTAEEEQYAESQNYWYEDKTKAFIFLSHDQTSEKEVFHLKYVKFGEDNNVELWQVPRVDNLVFSSDGKLVTFLIKSDNGEKSIWYCDLEKQRTVKLLDDHSPSIDAGLEINDILGFNKDNNNVFFTLITKLKTNPRSAGVDIYSYKDLKLQSQQLEEIKARKSQRDYKVIINIDNGHMTRLENENEFITGLYSSNLPNKRALIGTETGDFYDEWNWNKNSKRSFYLLSLRDGSKRRISGLTNPFSDFVFSPDEKYVIFYEPDRAGYYSFEAASGITRNITKGIRTKWTSIDRDDEPVSKLYNVGIAGFTQDQRYVLLYDQNDIYKADLSGRTPPINLTEGYGHKHHVVFTIPGGQDKTALSGKIMLDAFNKNNKDQGFYMVDIDHVMKPDSLTMLPVNVGDPKKARDADVYLVTQSDVKLHANIFFSADLRHFTPITHFHPESKYNWLTSELINWRLPNGKPCQGVLYKPENFDPRHKYPLIINYYEKKSDKLHLFLEPASSNGDINIPFYVSHGYLVFTPDIHYIVGYPGQSAFNAIVSGTKYLIRNRKYIDKKKVGLQGISFGGFETNYVIAHTNIFAAAMADCGMTDFISAYGSIIGGGESRQMQYELYRDRIGATPWQRPDLYMENSPVLRANLISTPLLMVANNNDDDVPHEQGVELFTALRRLDKKAWMLQYDGERHALTSEKAKSDYTTRVFQFFNYYLKGELPPKWMTQGVPAAMKGKDDGLALDTSGIRP